MAKQIQAGIHAVDLDTEFLKTSWPAGREASKDTQVYLRTKNMSPP
jgi:hypothetical protein